jgi:YggT family protein
MWIIVVSVILSWLVVFEVVNVRNEKAANLMRLLDKATDFVYKPLRKYVPAIGGIDITPIIVIFGIMMLQKLVARIFFG